MDAGMAIKPVVSVVSTHAQPAVALAPAAPTELPAAKTVGPVVNPAPARNEPQRLELTTYHTTHDAIIDPQTSEIVYRVLDARTRQVLHQVPEQALLRMQAYARAEAARALADGQNPVAAIQSAAQKINTLT
jgi:hypothetical protein